jgi:CheY-like chemotaxis protein
MTAPKKTILLVDERSARFLLRNLLPEAEYDVIEAGSAKEALKAIGSAPPIDLIVTDYIMPEKTGTGIDLIGRVRRREGKKIPAILHTDESKEWLEPIVERVRGINILEKSRMSKESEAFLNLVQATLGQSTGPRR